MYIYTHTYIYTLIHIHTYIYLICSWWYLCLHASPSWHVDTPMFPTFSSHMRRYVCMHAHAKRTQRETHTHTYANTCTRAYIRTYIGTCICIHTHKHAYLPMSFIVSLYKHTCNRSINRHVYAWIYVWIYANVGFRSSTARGKTTRAQDASAGVEGGREDSWCNFPWTSSDR